MSLITPFDPWGSSLCTCPKKLSLSAYTGCSHGCLYCYASSYIVNFSTIRPKKNFLQRLSKEIKKIPPSSYITMANSSDPYLPLEKKEELTRGALKILKDCYLRLALVTKSSLILRDLDILREFKSIIINISLTTLNESLAKRLEPYASLPKERLETMEKLSKYVTVICRFDPLIYPLNTAEIEKVINAIKNAGVKQIITSTYKVRPDNLNRMMSSFPEHKNTWKKLYLDEGERFSGYTYLAKDLRKELIEKVKDTCTRNELDFSSCREGFSDLNTKTCDGSDFF